MPVILYLTPVTFYQVDHSDISHPGQNLISSGQNPRLNKKKMMNALGPPEALSFLNILNIIIMQLKITRWRSLLYKKNNGVRLTAIP